MTRLCIAYLLLKSALRLRFTHFDRLLADILEDEPGCPDAIYIIANLEDDLVAPEAWADFVHDVKSALGG